MRVGDGDVREAILSGERSGIARVCMGASGVRDDDMADAAVDGVVRDDAAEPGVCRMEMGVCIGFTPGVRGVMPN